MKVIRLEDFAAGRDPISLSLGFFDGVHVGHREIIVSSVIDARLKGRKSAVFTFLEHPLKIICPAKDPPKLTTIEEKQMLMQGLGVDYFIWAAFDDTFCRIDPESFVRNLLIRKIGIHAVFAGPNYTFGHKAAGTPETLVSCGKSHGFEVSIPPPVSWMGRMVSSTLIREIVSAGDLVTASHLLGRYYCITGTLRGEYYRAGAGCLSSSFLIEYPREKITPGPGLYAVYFTTGMEGHRGICRIDKATHESATLQLYPLKCKSSFSEAKVEILFLASMESEIVRPSLLSSRTLQGRKQKAELWNIAL